jgi:hypothetical protein
MNKYIPILAGVAICAALAPEPIWAQQVAWDRTFGGADFDVARSVQQTSDGGYILAGHTGSYGDVEGDAWLIKTNSEGVKLWDRTFGGADGDAALSVQQTSDGGYIVTGYTESYDEPGEGDVWDVWLVKTDSQGQKLWDRTFGGTDQDEAYSVQQTSDGGHMVVGETNSYGSGEEDAWLIKTGSDGQKLWDRTFGGADWDGALSGQQTSDGGYILAGFTKSDGAGECDVWLIKTDSEGRELWDRTFGGADFEEAFSVQQTSDGGYIVAGYTRSDGADKGDVWLIKTDPAGLELWDRTFGGAEFDGAKCVQQTSDGGYIVACETFSYGAGKCDVWLIKTDSAGEKLWDRTFGGASDDLYPAVQQTSDGAYIVSGYTESYGAGKGDAWLIKIVE